MMILILFSRITKIAIYAFSSTQSGDSMDDEIADALIDSRLTKRNSIVKTKMIMSVERFSYIMAHADKEYDVEALVEKLKQQNREIYII